MKRCYWWLFGCSWGKSESARSRFNAWVNLKPVLVIKRSCRRWLFRYLKNPSAPDHESSLEWILSSAHQGKGYVVDNYSGLLQEHPNASDEELSPESYDHLFPHYEQRILWIISLLDAYFCDSCCAVFASCGPDHCSPRWRCRKSKLGSLT